jgi:hypothetical protein
MTDRLAEIEAYINKGYTNVVPIDVEWLIEEVKRLRKLEEGLRFEAQGLPEGD